MSSSYQPVTLERHGNKRWQRYSSYAFATRYALLPLLGIELPVAAMSLPIALVAHGSAFVPVAVVGMEPGQSLYVGADGRWMGGYVPAVLRGYPFAVLPMDDGRQVLCVDESSDLIGAVDGPLGAEAFFGADGGLSPALKAVLDFLQHTAASRSSTKVAAAALQAHGLIQPWAASVSRGGAEVAIQGLYRVDEAAMGALPDEAFLALRQAGSLPLAYTQLLSMQNLRTLGVLAEAQGQAKAQAAPLQSLPTTPSGDLDLSFMEGDTLRFT